MRPISPCVDTDALQWEAVPAQGAPSGHAAGTRLGLLATHQNVRAAISNDYGPNCYIVLESAGIPMYLSGRCKTVREAVEQFKAGKLAAISRAAGAGRMSQPAHRRFACALVGRSKLSRTQDVTQAAARRGAALRSRRPPDRSAASHRQLQIRAVGGG